LAWLAGTDGLGSLGFGDDHQGGGVVLSRGFAKRCRSGLPGLCLSAGARVRTGSRGSQSIVAWLGVQSPGILGRGTREERFEPLAFAFAYV
jgi:hypothetical protein